MSNLMEIQEQIRQVNAKIIQLTKEKSRLEKERSEGENGHENIQKLTRSLVDDLEIFGGNLKNRTGNIPGNFGQYYEKNINATLKRGGILEVETEATDVLVEMRRKILELDDEIIECGRKIKNNNSKLCNLNNLASIAAQEVENTISGGE